jgi:hypothetical protein
LLGGNLIGGWMHARDLKYSGALFRAYVTEQKPWLAFKVLAAEAIYPRETFLYTFKNGADFIVVGMFDFQIKENCQLTTKVVTERTAR